MFRSGRTLVLGFGREGRALERAVLERVPEARVEVLCDRPPDQPPRRWPFRIGLLEGESSVPGRVLRSPGVPVDHPVLERWRAAGVAVTCISSLWFGERPEARVIGVTGSKGKSTTAALVAHMLSSAGLAVKLGGNIGIAMLDLIDARADWFVVELSSYQLADLRGHASIGAITRLFPEHQDWHGSVDAYYAAKLRLLDLLQGRPLWINAGDPVLDRAVGALPGVRRINGTEAIQVRADGIWCGDNRLLAADRSPLPGRHNLDNIALALGLVGSVTQDMPSACLSLETFRPLRHRLERISGPNSTSWVNDSISTTPYATLAALQAGPPGLVLIVGGMERGSDWRLVAEYCLNHPPAGVIGLPDNGDEICRQLVAAGAIDPTGVRSVPNMVQAVTAAWKLCAEGGTVVLSPGAPSFPHFRDFEARGDAFVEAVGKLRSRDR